MMGKHNNNNIIGGMAVFYVAGYLIEGDADGL